MCDDGHRFDVARQGYVNLLGRAAPKNADTAEMIAARERFLGAGHYSPIAEALAGQIAGCRRVVEVGAGTAYYLARALPTGAFGLATDVSVPACRRAARAHERVAAVAADTWAGLPLADTCVDAVLCVFAPRNLDEFRRILRPGGKIVVVVPNTGHLAELRAVHGLLDVADHKAEDLVAQLGGRAERITYELDLDDASATDLVAMGPNAFHGAGPVRGARVTVDVSLVVS